MVKIDVECDLDDNDWQTHKVNGKWMSRYDFKDILEDYLQSMEKLADMQDRVMRITIDFVDDE